MKAIYLKDVKEFSTEKKFISEYKSNHNTLQGQFLIELEHKPNVHRILIALNEKDRDDRRNK